MSDALVVRQNTPLAACTLDELAKAYETAPEKSKAIETIVASYAPCSPVIKDVYLTYLHAYERIVTTYAESRQKFSNDYGAGVQLRCGAVTGLTLGVPLWMYGAYAGWSTLSSGPQSVMFFSLLVLGMYATILSAAPGICVGLVAAGAVKKYHPTMKALDTWKMREIQTLKEHCLPLLETALQI
ncbi:hypothetical protein HY639_00875 [Candidatus Woesearchaeota archaeon]|nr:hypothetical protein [Candidatus Woesearchaeota archaeon]